LGNKELEAQLARMLNPIRYRHSLGVARTAADLAGRHGCSPERAYLAGLLHDIAREMPPEELLYWAEQAGIPVHPVERRVPELLHAPVGAFLASTRWSVSDPAVLQAIARHTTGYPGMSLLDQVVFVADLVEPSRNYPGVNTLRRAVETDFTTAMIMALDQTIRYVLSTGGPLHPVTVEARNSLIDQTRRLNLKRDEEEMD